MMYIITLCKRWYNLDVLTPKNVILSNFNVMRLKESNIPAPVLLNLLNLLRKRDKMLGKPSIL